MHVEVELGFFVAHIPDAKIGGAIVNDDGSRRREEPVIRVPLNL